MRKLPTQARAKERVERILDATEQLIIEGGGVAALTVNEIAVRAEVPIGSLYQYFSNRNEVLRALCDRHYKTLGVAAADCFTRITNVADFVRDVRKALNICWDYTRDNTAYRLLFFDVQAWEVMREADWQDTFLNAQRMGNSLQQLVPHVPYDDLLAFSMIVGDSASNTARLAIRFQNLQEELMEQFSEMVESRLYTLLRDDAVLERTLAAAADASLAPATV